MKILGYIIVIVGIGTMALNGNPRSWTKGTGLKHILIDMGGALVMLAGLWLLEQ